MKSLIAFVLALSISLNGYSQTKNGKDSQRLIKTVETCASGNHESNDIQFLHESAKTFNLNELTQLADIRSQKVLDIRDSCLLSALDALLLLSCEKYGEISYEAITCRRYVVAGYSSYNWDKSMEMASANHDMAIKLAGQYPKDQRIQLLKHLTRLDVINLSTWRDPDNPTYWEEVTKIEKEVSPYLKNPNNLDADLIDICKSIANVKSMGTTHAFCLNAISAKIFPNETTFPVREINGVISDAEGIYESVYESSKHLWGENDCRTQMNKLQLNRFRIINVLGTYDELYQKADEIYQWAKDYLPEGDMFTIEAMLCKGDCDVIFAERKEEAEAMTSCLEKVKTFYGEQTEEYLGYLYRIFSQMQRINMAQASVTGDEMVALTKRLFQDQPDTYAQYLLAIINFNLAIYAENPEAFNNRWGELISLYLDNHSATWPSIYIGRSLAETYDTYLSQPDMAADMYRISLEDMRQLMGDDDPFYACSHYQYAQYLSSSVDSTRRQQTIPVCKDMLKMYSQNGFPKGMVYCTLSDFYLSEGHIEEGLQTLRDGISACTDKEEDTWRNHMQTRLGYQLLQTNFDNTTTLEAKQLFDEAIPFFMENRAEMWGTFLEGYYHIAYYYLLNGRSEEAESLLLEGMAHHDSLYGAYDNTYMDLTSTLLFLYTNITNDNDKAESLISTTLNNMRDNPSFSLHGYMISMLWEKYYYLLRVKNDDLVMQMSTLNDIINEYAIMSKLGNWSSEQTLERAATVLFEYSNIFPQIYNFQQKVDSWSSDPFYADYASSAQKTINTLKTSLSEQIVPLYFDLDNLYKAKSTSYLDDARTYFLYNSISKYYLNLENDADKAESYILPLTHSANELLRFHALRDLANMKYGQQDFAQSWEYLKTARQLSDNHPGWITGPSAKANFTLEQLSICMRSNAYSEAIPLAQEYFSLVQTMIQQNFDLLTQAERESFVNLYGAGGTGLLSLLPHFKEQLADDAYNAALAEKGLLLRASERIHNAIHQNADEALKLKMERLDLLRSEIQKINLQINIQQNIDAETKRFTQLTEEIESLERDINRSVNTQLLPKPNPQWQQVQQVLQVGEAAIEYVFSDSILGALVLFPQGNPKYVQLQDISQMCEGLSQMQSLPLRVKIRKLYEEDQLKLYDHLWKPIEKVLQDVTSVYFSPSGFLNELAFSAFRRDDGSYLIDRYNLHQLLSTGDLIDIRQHSSAQPLQSAILYGKVFYSDAHEQLAQQFSTSIHTEYTDTLSERGAISDDREPFGYLPYTEREVENVCQELNNNNVSVTRLTGHLASEQSLHEISGKSPDVIHLSTHGFFVAKDKDVSEIKYFDRFPLIKFSSMQRSGLALTDANATWLGDESKREEEDGILTANEVAKLDLSTTRLAVLSACQSAVGFYTTDGVFGIHRGFKQAGVHSIIGTLWNVNDRSTSSLMSSFYRLWLSGLSMQESMSQSIKQLRKDFPSPYFWAPFVLIDAEN